jgi:hypothetical protein
MTRRARRPVANDNLGHVVIALLPCGACREPIAEREGSIYAVVGTDVLAWCSPGCAACGGVQPWARAELACRATTTKPDHV